jgi:hypothetical protein
VNCLDENIICKVAKIYRVITLNHAFVISLHCLIISDSLLDESGTTHSMIESCPGQQRSGPPAMTVNTYPVSTCSLLKNGPSVDGRELRALHMCSFRSTIVICKEWSYRCWVSAFSGCKPDELHLSTLTKCRLSRSSSTTCWTSKGSFAHSFLKKTFQSPM